MSNGYSIIVTAYKTAKYLSECIQSILAQTFFEKHNEWEILIGVDGCEETLTVARSIAKRSSHIKVYMMNKNVGTYVTSNTLISLSKYDKIIRFDSDDIMIEHLVSSVDKYSDEFDIVRFKKIDFVDGHKGRRVPSRKRRIPHGVMMIKRSTIDLLGGYKSWPCSADTDLLTRARANEDIKIKLMHRSLFYCRKRADSLTCSISTGLGSELRQRYSSMIEDRFYRIEPEIAEFTSYE